MKICVGMIIISFINFFKASLVGKIEPRCLIRTHKILVHGLLVVIIYAIMFCVERVLSIVEGYLELWVV